jgi:hypothetical protein
MILNPMHNGNACYDWIGASAKFCAWILAGRLGRDLASTSQEDKDE